jgi:hypothetical protein
MLHVSCCTLPFISTGYDDICSTSSSVPAFADSVCRHKSGVLHPLPQSLAAGISLPSSFLTVAGLIMEPLWSIICGGSKPEIAERYQVFSRQIIDPSGSIIRAAMVVLEMIDPSGSIIRAAMVVLEMIDPSGSMIRAAMVVLEMIDPSGSIIRAAMLLL